MSQENQTTEQSQTDHSGVECGVSMDISTVQELRETLGRALQGEDPVIFLNADQVERADAAALQLLAVFFEDAHKAGFNVQWHQPSETLKKSAGLLGLSEQLELNA